MLYICRFNFALDMQHWSRFAISTNNTTLSYFACTIGCCDHHGECHVYAYKQIVCFYFAVATSSAILYVGWLIANDMPLHQGCTTVTLFSRLFSSLLNSKSASYSFSKLIRSADRPALVILQPSMLMYKAYLFIFQFLIYAF